MTMKSGRYLLSYSPGGSTRRQVGPREYNALETHIGEGEVVVGGQRCYYSK